MVLWKYSFREVVSRRGRAILTLASIVIAVATVVSVSVSTATTRRAYKEMFASVCGRASLEITRDGGRAFDDSVLADVETTPGVKLAVPMVKRDTILKAGGATTVAIVGIDPAKDRALYDYTLVEGKGLSPGEEGVLLESSFARALGVNPNDPANDRIKLFTPKKGLNALRETKVRGTFTSQSAASLWLGGMIFMPLEQAQDWFTDPGQVDMIEIILDDSADERTVMEALAQVLPRGLSVGPPRSSQWATHASNWSALTRGRPTESNARRALLNKAVGDSVPTKRGARSRSLPSFSQVSRTFSNSGPVRFRASSGEAT